MQLTLVNHAFAGGPAAVKLAAQLAREAGLAPAVSPFGRIAASAQSKNAAPAAVPTK